MTFKNAKRNTVGKFPEFGVQKESRKPQDLVRLISAVKDGSPFMEVVQVPWNRMEAVINDETITKIYYSSEIAEEFKLVPLLMLGLDHLLMVNDVEGYREAQDILYGYVDELRKQTLRRGQ